MDRRESWKQECRAFYFRYVTTESGQGEFDFARRDTIIYTNLGMSPELDSKLIQPVVLYTPESGSFGTDDHVFGLGR